MVNNHKNSINVSILEDAAQYRQALMKQHPWLHMILALDASGILVRGTRTDLPASARPVRRVVVDYLQVSKERVSFRTYMDHVVRELQRSVSTEEENPCPNKNE